MPADSGLNIHRNNITWKQGMSLALIISFIQYGIVMAFTPGPNNMMLATSGANFGFKKTLGHILGVTLGFPLMLLTLGFGFSKVFELYPSILFVLKIVCFIYLLYLAYKLTKFIPHKKSTNDVDRLSKPISFFEAFFFQWVNPKGISTAMIALTAYTTIGASWSVYAQIIMLVAISFIISFLSAATWCLFGKTISPYLHNDKIRIAFNYTMAMLMVGSVVIAMLLGS